MIEPFLGAAIMLWLAIAAVMIMTLPPLPVDETRYLTVAWEMNRFFASLSVVCEV